MHRLFLNLGDTVKAMALVKKPNSATLSGNKLIEIAFYFFLVNAYPLPLIQHTTQLSILNLKLVDYFIDI